jgi:Uma2 family endonuclease
MSDMASVYERHRITLDEYHRMAEAHIFDPDSRIELIEGELIEMAPIHPPHASAVDRITQRFVTEFAGRGWVRCQNPVTLRPSSEPQPDLVLARLDPHGYRDHHPHASDILLLVEVAESSLEADRSKKIPLYARSRIPEVWLVNLIAGEVIVHRQPTGAWYGSIHTLPRGDSISPMAFPDVSVAVEDLLPPAQAAS